MSAPTYRAVFADPLTDRLMDVLPILDVSMDRRISGVGSMSGTIPVPDAAMARRVQQLKETKTAVYLYRNGDAWWGGMVWTLVPKGDARGRITCELQAATFESYLDRVIISTDLAPLLATDQLAIARSFVTDMQTDTTANIGITMGSETSGILKDRVAYKASEAKTYLDAIGELAEADNGFEYTIDTYRDPNTGGHIKRLRLGYPTLGATDTPHVFSRPGNVLSWAWPGDGTQGGTRFRARGASINQNQTADAEPLMSSVYSSTDLLTNGFPRLDVVTDHTSVTDLATLNSYAAADLARAAGSVVIPQLTVRLEDATLTPSNLGDRVRVRLIDDWFGLDAEGQPVLNALYRVVAIKIRPAERGQAESADLALEA